MVVADEDEVDRRAEETLGVEVCGAIVDEVVVAEMVVSVVHEEASAALLGVVLLLDRSKPFLFSFHLLPFVRNMWKKLTFALSSRHVLGFGASV
jgi:hypothetical protein